VAEGFMDYTAGAVLTAAQVDDYLMRQTVMRFADATARNSALSGVVVEGMCAYLKDVNTLTVYDGSAWWTVGHAANTTIGYSPTITQGGGAQAHTVNVSEWRVVSGICEWWFELALTSGGVPTTAVTITLPLTANGASRPAGVGLISDSSASTQDTGLWYIVTTTTISFIAGESTTGYWGVTPNLAIASGDVLAGALRYRIATAA
jgi:hypothetical protein